MEVSLDQSMTFHNGTLRLFTPMGVDHKVCSEKLGLLTGIGCIAPDKRNIFLHENMLWVFSRNTSLRLF